MTWEELFERFEADFEIPEHFEGRSLGAIVRDAVWEEWRTENAARAKNASWSEWARKALLSIQSEVARAKQDPWTKKFQSMEKSLALRKDRPRVPISERQTLYQYGIYKSKTWAEAFIRMQSTILGQLRKERLRKESPWILWSETVAKNHRMKSRSIKSPTM